MNYDKFYQGLEDIYNTFGKKMPEANVVERIFSRVKDLPDRFMQYAVKHFEDQEKLPQNMGMYLFRNLWPDFLDSNPNMKSTLDVASCPKCDPNIPGYRKIYEQEKTGWGETVWKPVLVRCACGNAPNPRNEPVYTDSELEAKGYALKCPFHWDRSNMPECLRSALNASDEVRPSHAECIERLENGDW